MVGGAKEKSFMTVGRRNAESSTLEGLRYTLVGLVLKDSASEIFIVTQERCPSGDLLSERSADILVCPILEKAGGFYAPQNPV